MVRVKLRYLTCRLWRPERAAGRFTVRDIVKAIKDSAQASFGDFGMASVVSSFSVKYFDESTQIFIVRCKRESFRSAWAAMTLLSSIAGSRASISVLRVSSSVRTCRREAMAVLLEAAGVSSESEAGQAYLKQVESAISGV